MKDNEIPLYVGFLKVITLLRVIEFHILCFVQNNWFLQVFFVPIHKSISLNFKKSILIFERKERFDTNYIQFS